MKFMQRSLMGLFLLALTLGLLALAGGSLRSTIEERMAREARTRPVRERVFAVNVLLVEQASVRPTISVFGEIRSRRTLDLRAPISGTIVELSENFVEGGRIAKGELLLRLDPADAEAGLAVSQTELTEAEADVRESRAALILAGDELAAARSQVSLRQTALVRQESLLSKGIGTEAAVETAALALSAADQAVLAKRQAAALAEARVNRAGTTLSKRRIGLNEAIRRLKNTEVFAEFDGVLGTVSVLQGGLVGTNERIGRLIDPTALEVAFRVSSLQYARLVAANGGTPKGDVIVRLEVFGEDVISQGVIERVSAEVGDGQTGRQVFAALAAESAARFKPGDFVSVEVAEPLLDRVAILPATALDAAGRVLLIGENDRLEDLQLEVLRRQGDKVIARGQGLFGREIVVSRSPILGAGIKVKPVRKGGAAPQAVEMIELTPERRAKLVAFVENNPLMPDDAKTRVLTQLKQDKVPAAMVERIESRMGDG